MGQIRSHGALARSNSLRLNFPDVVSLCVPTAAPTVQAGPQAGSNAGDPHTDPARHHPGSLAVREDPQAPGPPRTRVHQL